MALASQTPRTAHVRGSSNSITTRPVMLIFGALVALVGLGAVVALLVWPRADAAQPTANVMPGVIAQPAVNVAAVPAASPTPVVPAVPVAPSVVPTLAAPVVPTAGNLAASGLPPEVAELMQAGSALMARGDLLGARERLNAALLSARTPETEREPLRRQISALNDTLVFSPTVAPSDPLFGSYAVQPGDSITKVMRSQSPFVDRLFLGRINALPDVNKLRVGQKLKVPRQPFHVIVHKAAFRADVYMGPPLPADATIGTSSPIESRLTGWTYIRSFPVGLGESDGTPEGLFVVRPSSKLMNPEWINLRDRTRYLANDPTNPIGEHWVGLEGAEERTRTFTGYGIHGTVDPASVGKQQSMGCVRLLAPDVAIVYEILAERVSMVWIVK